MRCVGQDAAGTIDQETPRKDKEIRDNLESDFFVVVDICEAERKEERESRKLGIT